MTAKILDGKRIADTLLKTLKAQVDAHGWRLAKHGPVLRWYWSAATRPVKAMCAIKAVKAEKVGIRAFDYDLPAGNARPAAGA